MNSGCKVVKELEKHGLRGFYFSYRQYKDLVKISALSEVKKKIENWGYPQIRDAKTEEEVVAALRNSSAIAKTEKGCLVAMFLEPLFWLILLLFSGC
ncbi:MAG: hypothetical protein Q7U02_02215 [Desulfosalsimonadaceae bacterium]|nr:hypothetical protein [Desulfosalsimonadaceae bacterium]